MPGSSLSPSRPAPLPAPLGPREKVLFSQGSFTSCPKSRWLLAPSSLRSSPFSSQPFPPSHKRIKKLPRPVTAPVGQSNSLDPVRLHPQPQPSASPAHPFLRTRGFQQHVSIPVRVSTAQMNSPDACAPALPAAVHCCSYKWRTAPAPRSSCIWRYSCNSPARQEATLSNLHL